MNRIVILCVAVFGLLSTCAAQFRPCQFTQISHAERSEGIAISRVSLIEPSGEVGASVFIPDSNEPLPGIVFSHSAIHGAAANADLLVFAWALARAGATSIILDGAIEWQTPNDESIRDPHLLACAGQWLLLHAKVDRRRRAFVGAPGAWGGGETPMCQAGESPCWRSEGGYTTFGETSPTESHNTDAMLTLEGRLFIARWIQRHLKLREIRQQWLEDTSNGSPK